MGRLSQFVKRKTISALKKIVFNLFDAIPYAFKSIMLILIKKIEKKDHVFYSLHRRPQRSANIGTHSDNLSKSYDLDCAIIIQGPIVRENDFTLETIRLYKQHYPQSRIIVSTWENEKDEYTESFLLNDIDLIYNKLPENPGYWNINCQIASTNAGITRAKKLGCLYVMKCRSDQRFYEINLLNFFVSVLAQFPLTMEVLKNQSSRLIVMNLYTNKYRAYSISDMFMFGTLNDIERYWDVPFDQKLNVKRMFKSMMEEIRLPSTEVYLVSHYMKKHNRELLFTIRDSWDILAKHFCVLDTSMLDLCFRKYDTYSEYREKEYEVSRTSELVTFKEWLLLYNNLVNENVDEKISYKYYGEKI